MDLFIGLFCLFIFVCFVAVLVISVSVLQWQLEATSGAQDRALRGWKRAVEELNLVEWLLQPC